MVPPIRAVAGFVPFAKGEIEQSIPGRFEQQVKAHAERIAVKSERYVVTYAVLNQWANRVAHALIRACGTVSEPIALLLDRDAPHVAAILGVLKAGKFYVPLAPSYPLARNQLILDDSQARWIVTDNANLRAAWELAGDTASILNVDALEGSTSPTRGSILLPTPTPTSSTRRGRPAAPRGSSIRIATCSTTS